MSKRYSGKSFKDSSVMKKAKLTLKEKRKLKKQKKKNKSFRFRKILKGMDENFRQSIQF